MEPHGDAVAVVGSGAEALENEEIESALDEIELTDGHVFPSLDDLGK